MKNFQQPILAALLWTAVQGNNRDMFNYDTTRDGVNGGRFGDFGPADWNKVSCDDVEECSGFPNPWTEAIGWDLENTNAACEICVRNDIENNNCKWCPADGENCGQTRQSPINLSRDRGLWNHENEKECPDWHFMKYQDGACTWDNLVDNSESIHRNNFLIRRHALQILQPVDDRGVLRCRNDTTGLRKYPRLDYSKGFPNWWHLAHTEISVPSAHTQEGKRYDAEVTLAHFYELEEPKNQLGKVAIFLQAYEGITAWPMLDKLICQWRESEEKVREDCGLDSVTTYYPGCTNYDRGHTPSPVDPETLAPIITPEPTTLAPITPAPTPAPVTPEPTSESPTVSAIPTGAVETAIAAAQPLYYAPCNICGSESLRIVNETAVVRFPAFEIMTCRQYENAGLMGMILPEFCRIFPAFTQPCECTEVAQVTDAPSGSSYPSESSLPSLSGVDAPMTGSSVTVAPVTMAPVTTAPVTTAPVTAAPVTTAPVTAAPVTGAPVTAAPVTGGPVTAAPVTTTPAPSDSIFPSSSPSGVPVPTSLTPPEFDCRSFSDVDLGFNVNYGRMCRDDDGCCDSESRSGSDFCHDAYALFGNVMPSVCYHCCDTPKLIAPEPAPHPVFDRVDCSQVHQARRICDATTPTSCCGEERSTTAYCRGIYGDFADAMNSVCWYCCETPMLVGPPLEDSNRRLRSGSSTSPRNLEWPKLDTEERRMELLKKVSEREEDEDKKQARLTALHHPVAESRMHHIKAGADNNEIVHEIDDDDEYFAAMMDRHLKNDNIIKDLAERERRRLVNYEDVSYWPYEWLMKVDTEYYFRYEGTQDVPPCKDQVHLRIMKDPIQVAQRQIDELERLMFERISPDDADFKRCEPDHAGAPRADTADKFDFVRPIQQNHKLHRKVLCECKDWKSKFDADREWCKRSIIDRFYDRPYNFDTEEFFDTSGVF